ncbi:deazapurine DNA modification protein DpdA family protein [Micromonosporaceae bacterium Da 78-11]
MSAPCFYLGSHMPNWLESPAVPRDVNLFISHRRLAGRRSLPKARVGWALDSGGFSELSLYGEWRTSPAEYVAAVQRYDDEMGLLGWAAPQDWMCEPFMLAKTGLTVEEHQRRTVANFVELRQLWQALDPSDELRSASEHCPFMPVLQGWQLADYFRCADMYAEAGINLSDHPVVGVGSVCRRQATDEIGEIFEALSSLDIAMHGFGVKKAGLRAYGRFLSSADSMAWSFEARRGARMDGCSGHLNCANCLAYALRWHQQVVGSLGDPAGAYQAALPIWELAS